MYLIDFINKFDVKDHLELRKVLEIRHKNDANSFWISEKLDSFPKLGILSKGDLNTLTYFSALGGAAFRSIGKLEENRDGNTVFYLDDGGEKEIVPNQLVVVSDCGLKAAEEFLITQDLPKSIDWLEI